MDDEVVQQNMDDEDECEEVNEEAPFVEEGDEEEEQDDDILTDDEFNEAHFNDNFTIPFIYGKTDNNNDDAEEVIRRRPWARAVKIWDENSVIRGVELRLVDIFQNAEVFRRVARNYCAEQAFSLGFTRNEKFDIRIACEGEGCTFYVWCGRLQGTEQISIKTIHLEHSCTSVEDDHCVTYDILAHRYLKYIRDHKVVDIDDFTAMIKT